MNDRAQAIRIPRGVAAAIAAPTFDRSRDAVRAAVAFLAAADPRHLLALAGPPGTGKSAAAAHAIVLARSADRTVGYLDGGEHRETTLPGEPLAARWAHAGDLWSRVYEPEVWRDLRRVPALVLDDLGAEPKDEKAIPLLASLLCERVDDARKTLVTTNLDPGAFRARYGDRVFDRMRDHGWRGVTGASLRGGPRVA